MKGLQPRILIVGFSNALSLGLSYLEHSKINIAAIVSVETVDLQNILSGYRLSCKVYPIDALAECVTEVYFDYAVLCGYEEEVFEQLILHGIPKERIIDLRVLTQSIETYSLCNVIKYYLATKEKFEVFISGMSYAYNAIDLPAFSRKAICFTGPGQDLFYDYQIAKYVLDNKRDSTLKYAIIGLSAYSFQYDVTKSFHSYRMFIYYFLLKNSHNYHVSKEVLSRIFNENFFALADSITNELKVDLNDRYSGKTSNTIGISQLLGARKRAEVWKMKNYPETVAENIEIFQAYIKLCHFHNVKPIVVIFPTSIFYYRWFPKRILESILLCY